jgi:hypothetical protein
LSFIVVGPLIAANYITVRLTVSAPEKWQKPIRDGLETKLNAIPDVQVVGEEDEAMFTIDVDINSVTNKSDEILGYSLAALIYGNYDQAILKVVLDEAEKAVKSKEEKAWIPVLQYAVSGNVFVAAFIHTHGAIESISEAYDEIVGKLKSKALPEYRRMEKLVAEAVKNGAAPRALPTVRQ